jgi:hypothetical protein
MKGKNLIFLFFYFFSFLLTESVSQIAKLIGRKATDSAYGLNNDENIIFEVNFFELSE